MLRPAAALCDVVPLHLQVWVGRHSTTCVSFQFYATTPRAAHISPAVGDAPPSQVLVVEDPAHVGSALEALRASMQDPVVAIDLEWRPEFGRRFTPVAMVQLASSRVAVLIRACRMGYKLPPALREFLRDPSVSLLGFGWAGSDEGKMRSTFGTGCQDFGRFLDLQKVAQGLGYCGFGLARLTTHVLGLTLPKSKRISMSNWEVKCLSMGQVRVRRGAQACVMLAVQVCFVCFGTRYASAGLASDGFLLLAYGAADNFLHASFLRCLPSRSSMRHWMCW